MSDTASSLGGGAYQSQTTKALTSISESPGPDLSDGEQQFVEMLSRHDYQIKFLADNQQALQVGVNQATANPIQQIQQFIADLQVLFSGASLPKGALDFGDMQYILPAIGALFGFGTGEYPINLFDAAEKFFFGYVVPNQQYTDLQIAGFNSWATELGIDPTFIKDMDAMTQAFGDLFNGLQNVGPSLASLFDSLGISGTDLGPLGQLLAPILQWFAPIDFSKFGSMIEWLTDAIDPWITSLTAVINWVNSLLAAIGAGGDVVNSPLPQVTIPFENLIKLFATLDLSDPQFSTSQGWGQLFNEIFVDLEQFIAGVWSALTGAPLNAGNIYGQLSPGVYSNVPSTAISAEDANLLDNGGFQGAVSVAGDGTWVWDPIVFYQSDDDSAGIAGSVKVVADGTEHVLYSNRLTVGAGQKVVLGRTINFSVQGLGTHLTGTGTPVQMGVRTNLGTTILAQVMPASNPVGSGWENPPTGSLAGTLAADAPWLVPLDGSVTWFCMVLVVTATATSGEVRFDDARMVLHGGLIAELQDDLTDLQDESTRANAALVAMLQAWSTAVETYATNFDWAALITAFQDAWNTYITTITTIEGEEAITIQQIINSLFGINPGTGQIPQSQIEDLVVDLSDAITTGDWTPLLELLFGGPTVGSTIQPSALPAAWQTVIDDFTAFLSTGDWSDLTSAWTDLNQALWGQDSVGSTLALGAVPTDIPQSYIENLETDLADAITTGDWTPLLTALFGGTTVASTIQVGAVPTGIPQSHIQDLVTDLGDAITTGDWNPLLTALFGTTSVGSSIQHAALPSSYSNLNQDLLNLFNDVIFASGRSWSDIGADLTALVNDLVGSNITHTITPGQIPPAHVGSTGSGSDIGADVSSAQSAASSAASAASAASTTASAASDSAQAIVDNISAAVNGGTPSGTSLADVVSNLMAIPQDNIAIDITSASAVTFDSVGAGGGNYGGTGVSNSITAAQSHTIGASANYLVAAVMWASNGTPASVDRTVHCGGRAMSSLGIIDWYDAPILNVHYYLEMFGMTNPPSGAQTVTATAAQLGATFYEIDVVSSAYIGRGAVSAAVTHIGTGHSLSLSSVPSATNSMVVQAFAYDGGAFTSYNKTLRYSGYPGGATSLALGDAAGASTVSFTASSSNSSNWGGIAVSLTPSGAFAGSTFRAHRGSTSTFVGTSGTNVLPTGFFDTNDYATSDLTPNSDGSVTISIPGTYAIRMQLHTITTYYNQWIGTALYRKPQGGSTALIENGSGVFIGGSFYTLSQVADTFLVYCHAGDTLYPGYSQSATGGSLTGDAAGSLSHWEVTLVNRSLL